MNPPLTLPGVLTAGIFIGLRLSGLVLFAPGFSNPAVPMRTKAALVVTGSALLWPVVPAPAMQFNTLGWVGVVLNEAMVGMLVGLALNFLFDAALFAGQVVGMQMGFSLATMMDPQSQADSPVLSIFYQTIVLLIFLALDVHHWLLRALVSSFRYLPAGQPVLTHLRAGAILHMAGSIWVLGLQIAAPALLATVVADFVLAFLGKSSPQLPVLFIGLSIKSVLGMLLTIVAMAAWPRFFALQFANAIRWSEQILHLAG